MNLIPIILLSFAQQVTLPPEIHGQPGQFISIPSVTDCKSVQWVVLDAGLNLFPVELLRDTTTAVVSANSPGKYRVLAYAAKGDVASKPVITTVIIGDPPEPLPDETTNGYTILYLGTLYEANLANVTWSVSSGSAPAPTLTQGVC